MINQYGEREFKVATTKVRDALVSLYTQKEKEYEDALLGWSKEVKEAFQTADPEANGGDYSTKDINTLLGEKPQNILRSIQKEVDYYSFLVDETDTPEVTLTFDDYHKFFKGEWAEVRNWTLSNTKYFGASR